MTAFLLYIGKVAILLAVFYLFYHLLLDRETFHRLNRAVLLLTVLAAFVLPACVITKHQIVEVAAPTVRAVRSSAVQPKAESATDWATILLILYLTGVTVKLACSTVNLYRLRGFIARCEQHPQKDGTVIAVSGQDMAPFSWWNTIVLSRADYEAHDPALLAHERAHINGYHSIDVMLMEVVIALQWFNPAAWLIGRELRSVHEYEADASALSSGIDPHHYLSLLMERANASHAFALANSISQKGLKSRFLMMARHRSKPSRLFKLLYVLPVVGITLALNARTVVLTQFAQKSEPQPTSALTAPIPPTPTSPAFISPEKRRASRVRPSKPIDTPIPKVNTPAEVTVSGTVVDEAGHPIIGTAVIVRDGKLGTVTDYDGNFRIVVPQGVTLDFKYIGVATESVTATQDVNQMTITLKKDDSDKE